MGSVNTVVFDGERAVGHNTDGTAFQASFEKGLHRRRSSTWRLWAPEARDPRLRPVLVRMGACRLTLVDEVEDRAETIPWVAGGISAWHRLRELLLSC